MWTRIKEWFGFFPLFGGVPRSPLWGKVRAAHLLKEPVCQICGGTKKITVHHLLPYHVDRTLELDPTNLMTLCEGAGNGNHHLIFGHFGNYATKWNTAMLATAMVWRPRFEAKTEEAAYPQAKVEQS
jgi:5-methylcytosine-specific restriction endonuclease McrA